MYHGFEHRHVPPGRSAITAWLIRGDAITAAKPHLPDRAWGTDACAAMDGPPLLLADAMSDPP